MTVTCESQLPRFVDNPTFHFGVRLIITLPDKRNVYESSITHPNIPYAIYVHENHLLIVPRNVETTHKEFPKVQDHRRFTLQLSDDCVDEYRKKHGQPPKFAPRGVNFGSEEDEGVVVMALLNGSNVVPYWDFREMLNGDQSVINTHFTEQSSDAEASFGMMQFDLGQAA